MADTFTLENTSEKYLNSSNSSYYTRFRGGLSSVYSKLPDKIYSLSVATVCLIGAVAYSVATKPSNK